MDFNFDKLSEVLNNITVTLIEKIMTNYIVISDGTNILLGEPNSDKIIDIRNNNYTMPFSKKQTVEALTGGHCDNNILHSILCRANVVCATDDINMVLDIISRIKAKKLEEFDKYIKQWEKSKA